MAKRRAMTPARRLQIKKWQAASALARRRKAGLGPHRDATYKKARASALNQFLQAAHRKRKASKRTTRSGHKRGVKAHKLNQWLM